MHLSALRCTVAELIVLLHMTCRARNWFWRFFGDDRRNIVCRDTESWATCLAVVCSGTI